MSDSLTQLQDALDELAQQFIASIYYVNSHHDIEKLDANDEIREVKQDPNQKKDIDPHPPAEFNANIRELARDLVYKEAHMEELITSLPGLENSERDQERAIKELEEELKAAEQQRLDAIRERKAVLEKIDEVIRSVRRP